MLNCVFFAKSAHRINRAINFFDLQTVVAVAMLVRRFDFQLAVGAPPVSNLQNHRQLPFIYNHCYVLLVQPIAQSKRASFSLFAGQDDYWRNYPHHRRSENDS